MILSGKTVSPGKGEGEAVVINTPFSFLGELDADTGKIPSPFHEQFGQSLKGKVLVVPTGKGSSMGPIIAWYSAQANNNPVAIICVKAESIIASAAITAGIPMVDRLEKNPFEFISTGDYVKVDATVGIVEVIDK
jgi:predicted aconitase with swiveling domain